MLYLLYGSDTFRSTQKLNEIIERAENLHRDKLSLRKIDLAEEGIEALERELETPSLFAPFRFVVLKNASADKEHIKKLKDLNDRYDLTKNKELILILHEENLEEKNILLQLVTKGGKVQRFSLLSKAGTASWAINFFLKRGVKISPEAIKILSEGVEGDLWRLNNECEKLSAWAANPNQSISAQNLAELVVFESDSNVFAVVDGILNKNSGKAVYDLEVLMSGGEDVTGLFYLLVKQFQNLSQLFGLVQKGPLPANTAKILNIHPYAATKLSASLRKWPEKELKNAFDKLARYDLAIKTGAQDARLALTLLSANI